MTREQFITVAASIGAYMTVMTVCAWLMYRKRRG